MTLPLSCLPPRREAQGRPTRRMVWPAQDVCGGHGPLCSAGPYLLPKGWQVLLSQVLRSSPAQEGLWATPLLLEY